MSIQSSSKRIRISNENATVYECKTCSKVFSRSKSYNDHIRLIHSKKVQDGATSVVDELAATEGPSFENVGLPANSSVDNAKLYELVRLGENTFPYSELLSIWLSNIVTKYAAPQEMHRELVNLMETMRINHDRIEPNGQILHHDVLDRLMKKKAGLKSDEYDVCVNGCKLFNTMSDNVDFDESCIHCDAKRYKKVNGVVKAAKKMKMMPLGEQIAIRLGNDKLRSQLMYPENRERTTGVLTDIHDGAILKRYASKLSCESEMINVYVMLFVDGFVNQKKGKRSMTMFHASILNIDPSYRSEDNSMIQLAILPGPKKPANLDSFLSPLIDELKKLSTAGIIVKMGGEEVCRARVHLVMATGDIVGISELIHHAGHNSKNLCRICLGTAEHPDNHPHGQYLLDTSAPLRKKIDFVNGDDVNGLKKPTIFSDLPSFCGALFFGLDEMHLLGGGVAKLVYELLTFPTSGKASSKNHFYYLNSEKEPNVEGYPFEINHSRELGKTSLEEGMERE